MSSPASPLSRKALQVGSYPSRAHRHSLFKDATNGDADGSCAEHSKGPVQGCQGLDGSHPATKAPSRPKPLPGREGVRSAMGGRGRDSGAAQGGGADSAAAAAAAKAPGASQEGGSRLPLSSSVPGSRFGVKTGTAKVLPASAAGKLTISRNAN